MMASSHAVRADSLSWRSPPGVVPATAARARPRVARRAERARGGLTHVTRAFIPNMIPNPAYRWGDDTNPDAPPKASLDDMLRRKHAKWRVGHERGADETDTVWRTFKARDEKSARVCLDLLQEELYVNNEQGCRIRRETQGIFYMCCDGVRVRVNEPKRRVLVEVPLPGESYAALEACDRQLAKVEEVCKKAKAA